MTDTPRERRRQLLKAMGAAGLLGTVAGCEAPTSSGTATTDRVPGCETSVVEPTVSGGQFTLFHGRRPEQRRLLEGTKTLFEERYRSTLRLERSPGGFTDTLRTSITVGRGPHLFMWGHGLVGAFVEQGLLSDQSDTLRVEDCTYLDPAWDAVDYQGPAMDDSVTIGLPFAGGCPALIYNRDILEELGRSPPTTFAEWRSIMDAYHDPERGQYGLAHPIEAYFCSWAAQANGTEIYDGEAAELGIAAPELARVLDILLEDLAPYIPTDHTEPAPLTEEAQVAVFENGNAPFLVDGPWVTPDLEAASFEYGVQPIVTPSDATARPYSNIQMIYFAEKMDTDNTAVAAREFAEWYTTSDDRILNLVTNTGFVPVKAGLAEHEQLSATTRGFARQFETSVPIPQTLQMGEVWVPFEQAILEAFQKGVDVGPLLEDAAAKIRQSEQWN